MSGVSAQYLRPNALGSIQDETFLARDSRRRN